MHKLTAMLVVDTNQNNQSKLSYEGTGQSKLSYEGTDQLPGPYSINVWTGDLKDCLDLSFEI